MEDGYLVQGGIRTYQAPVRLAGAWVGSGEAFVSYVGADKIDHYTGTLVYSIGATECCVLCRACECMNSILRARV